MRLSVLIPALLLLSSAPASAGSLVLANPAPERLGTVAGVYRMDERAGSSSFLELEWTDEAGRIVQHLRVKVEANSVEVPFALDMRRAVATRNHLSARLGDDASAATLDFIARPPADAWSDYQIIMWPKRSPEQLRALKAMGITAGLVQANRTGAPRLDPDQMDPLLRQDLRFYVENIATDFFSAYHRWFPDRPVNALFLETQQRLKNHPNDPSAFVRDPGLSDPGWLARIATRLDGVVQLYKPYRPLYYDLGDETGIADLSAFWDFDLSDSSLAGMRDWLRQQYGSLAALNAEWGTAFARWEDVTPTTTTAAMRRTDGNFASWADFKAWMDVAFARALRSGTDAVHKADPQAPAAIEGAQMPGWGGYDYTQLATAVDLMEIYDSGENVEIARSLNPSLRMLTTSFEDPLELHDLWRALLRGTRGLILWDQDGGFVGPDGAPGPRGRALGPSFALLRGGLGALLLNSERQFAPIGILYSPASFRTQWMLDHAPEGEAWSRRHAEAENEDNSIRRSTAFFTRLDEHLGLQHRFLSPAMIAEGALQAGSFRVLMLPHVIALSPAEADGICAFVREGGVVIADGEPGVFDEHSRRLARPALADLFPTDRATGTSSGGKTVGLEEGARNRSQRVQSALRSAGIEPTLHISGPAVEAYLFRNGPATIVALQRDPPKISGPSRRRPNDFAGLPAPRFRLRPACPTALRVGTAVHVSH